MSAQIVQGIRAASLGPKPASMEPHPPAPLIAPTGSPGLNCVIDVVNQTAAPFQSLPSGQGGAAGVVANAIGGVLGVVGAPSTILDTAFAALTAPIAKLFPALPAVTLLGMHVGPPHGHLHPPSYTPPATPAPVPLPSLGVLLGAGSVGVLVGGLPAARAGDIGIAAACGSTCPPFEVHTGSSNVFIGGARAARIGDITRHCNPVAMAGLGLAMAVAGVVAGAAGAVAFGNVTAAAQAAADAAVLALKMLVGKDIAVPPAYGALIGPPVGNVLIGGFPCPPLMETLMGLLKKLKKPPGKGKGKASEDDNAPCGSSRHPVNLVTGAAFDTYVEFVSGGLFEWRRHYSSDRAGQDGPLGHGSRHSYQYGLRVHLHRAIFTHWNGEQVEFPRFERGSNVASAKGYVLKRVDETTYRVSYLDRPELEFVGDRFAGELTLVRVRKDRSELLITRDAAGRITALTETNHTPQTQRRFELVLDHAGRVQQLVEVPTGPAASEPVVWRSYQYSDASDLIASGDANGALHRFEYDSAHRLIRDVSPLGFCFRYRYDERGRVVETAGQDGLWAGTLSYPKDGITVLTDGGGGTREIHYDHDGLVTKTIDAYGGTLTRETDADGRVTDEVDAAGRRMRRLYDANGAHYARLDDFGHMLPPATEAPVAPNPLARALPATPLEWLLGDFAPRRGGLGKSGLWPISWDGAAFGAVAGVPAHAAHLLAAFVLRQSSRALARSPRVDINALGQKVQETDERGSTRRWYYDAAGNLAAEQDREGSVHYFTNTSWNLRGQQTNEVGQTIRYQYSSEAKVTAVIDPFGSETRYDYDLKKRLVRVHRHGRVRDEYVYDLGSHFIEKRDGGGQILFKNEPHKNHLVGKRTLASGGYHQFDYDDAGHVTEASTQDHDVKLAYRGGGSWPSGDLRDQKGVEHVPHPSGTDTRVLERFRARRETVSARATLQDPTGQETTLTYYEGIVRRFCSNGSVETLQFDPEGRLLARVVFRAAVPAPRLNSGAAFSFPPARVAGAPSDGTWATRYTYTLEGDLARVDDSVRGTTVFEVDKAHRLTAEVTARGERLEYWQDAANNVVAKPGLPTLSLQRGNLLAASREETFEHDARDHLALRTRQDGAQVRYHYDSFDMLVAIERQTSDGKISRWEASYDALGRRIRAGEPGEPGSAREFYWDYDRLAAEILPGGGLRIYQYASRTSLIPIGFTDYQGIDAPPESGRSYVVYSDPVGMPLCIEDEEGYTVWWAERIDPYGAIQVADGSSVEYNVRWPGHYYDPETGLHYNRWRYYDPTLGRYLQSDPIGYGGSPINLYAYAPNPLVQVDLLGLATCETDDGESHPKKNGDNDGQEQTPKRPSPTPEELKAMQAHCTARADAIREHIRAQYGDRTANATTVSVSIVENRETGARRTVVTTSRDPDGTVPPKSLPALQDGETNPPTRPLLRNRKDGVVEVDPETGAVVGPYGPKGNQSNGYTGETRHHGEQRTKNGGAMGSNEEIVAMSHSNQQGCCPGCRAALGKDLGKVDPSRA